MQTTTATPAVPLYTTLVTTITIPRIGTEWPEQGGRFLGIVAGADGQPDYLLILGPAAPKKLKHAAALQWARGLKLHGFEDWDLPNRNDGPVAYGNGRTHIEPDWYWLSEQHAEYAVCAWCQSFGYGLQDTTRKHTELRARAVRRLVI